MRRLRLPVLLALAMVATVAAPALAQADGTGPSIDSTSLYSDGRPCATAAPVVVDDASNVLLQAVGTDPGADPNQTQDLTYTFALWPTADPSAELDRTATATSLDLVTESFDPGLAADTDYSWRVRLTDGNGSSDWSQTCLFHNDPTPPATAPTVTSSNFPTDGRGPYGEPALFTLDANGDPDTVAFQYAVDTNPGVDQTCTNTGPQGQLVCTDPLTASDTVAADAAGGTASLSVPAFPAGGTHYLAVASRDAAGNVSELAHYTFFVPVPLAPVPTIGGEPSVGSTLTATAPAWSPTPTSLDYQWLADGVAIAGATDLSYVVQPSDADKSISFSETGVRTNIGSTTQVSTALLIVPLTFAVTPKPTVSGTAVLNQVLTADPGAWSPAATFSYLWLRNGTPIAGAAATTAAYQLTAADAGAVMSVRVTGSWPGYLSVAEVSAPTTPVLRLLSAPAVPGISGVHRYGQVLTAVPGAWGPAPVVLSYRWYLGALPIPGAISPRYVPPASYLGKPLSVAVTGSKPGYLPLTRRSGAIVVVPARFTVVGTPRIAGLAHRGSVLTASMPATTPASAHYLYQWRSNGVAVLGQTSSRYVVRSVDVDRRISVVVTAVRSGYASVQRASAATAVVPGQAYSSCKNLNAVYPHGVARAGVRYDLVRGRPTPFKGVPFFSTNLYNLNTGRDGDHDGIGCER